MISLAILDRFPWWVLFLILFREIGITEFRLAVIRDGVIPASKGGKIKTLMQNFGVSFYILPLPSELFILRDLFMAAAVVLTITTGIDYVLQWWKSRKR